MVRRNGETGDSRRDQIRPQKTGIGWFHRLKDELDTDSRVILSPDAGAWPKLKRYIREAKGIPLQDIWDDIHGLSTMGAPKDERLGYPTQKPQALLERIIQASSNEGDVVLDPFCGCGTAVAAAQKLNRQWIGIDITFLAIDLIKRRLKDSYGDQAQYQVIGEPYTVSEARRLAARDPFQFEWWAVSLLGARGIEKKKGADRGIDGRLYFVDDATKATKQIVIQVKSGKLHAGYIRDLRGVIEREGAEIGVLIALHEPTRQMRSEASTAGYYQSPWGNHPRMQILTIEELLAGRCIDMPPLRQTSVTYKKAPRQTRKQGTQLSFDES